MFDSFVTRSSRSPFVPSTSGGAALLLILLALSACANGSRGSATTTSTLQSIEITPTNPSLAAGTSTQLAATAIYSDNSHADVTAQVPWSASNTVIATVGASTGKALALSTGSATLKASLQGHSASTTLTVTGATLVSVSQYTIGAGGVLSPMTPGMVGAGNKPYSVTVDPTGRYVYVTNANGNTVSQYTIGAGGALSPMTPASFVTGASPYYMTVDPSGRYAYVVNYASANTVSQYTIGAGGALSPMTPAMVNEFYPWSVTVDPSGRYAYVTNVNTNSVSQYTIGAGGALSPMSPASVGAGISPLSVTTTD